MSEISVGPAISAGFRLIGREPLTFLIWCAIYFAMSALPAIFTWSDTTAYYQALGAGAAMTDPAIQPAFGPWRWLSLLLTLVLAVCLPCAVMRAVLYPDDRRFFFLALGPRELWLALAAVVLFLLWIAGYLVMLLTVGIVAAVGAGAGQGGAAFVGIIVLLLVPVLLAAGVWVWVRLSMSTMMSFAEKRLRVLASWRFTKGHGLKIFLVALALFALTVLALTVLLGGSLAALAASASGAGAPSAQAFFAQVSQASLPALLAYFAVVSVLFVGMSVIGAASWAEMYRQLRPGVAETFA